ncbi:hypothetical protein J6590_072417 [Homalodisca vitripennis]|nr:hypothetical protein J6590_072417 [Homalodisca vitripennis]
MNPRTAPQCLLFGADRSNEENKGEGHGVGSAKAGETLGGARSFKTAGYAEILGVKKQEVKLDESDTKVLLELVKCGNGEEVQETLEDSPRSASDRVIVADNSNARDVEWDMPGPYAIGLGVMVVYTAIDYKFISFLLTDRDRNTAKMNSGKFVDVSRSVRLRTGSPQKCRGGISGIFYMEPIQHSNYRAQEDSADALKKSARNRPEAASIKHKRCDPPELIEVLERAMSGSGLQTLGEGLQASNHEYRRNRDKHYGLSSRTVTTIVDTLFPTYPLRREGEVARPVQSIRSRQNYVHYRVLFGVIAIDRTVYGFGGVEDIHSIILYRRISVEPWPKSSVDIQAREPKDDIDEDNVLVVNSSANENAFQCFEAGIKWSEQQDERGAVQLLY